MDTAPDFRPDLAAAQSWVTDLIASVRDDQLTNPTPCTDFDVRALLEHINALPAKLTTMAEGGNPRELTSRVDITPGSVAETFRASAADALASWQDDALLTTTVTAPWGPAPGAIAVGAFLMETLTHGWDLAVATGQDPEADPALAAKAQVIADKALAGAPRGGEQPFAEPVTAPEGAGPTTQLAAFLGRSPSLT